MNLQVRMLNEQALQKLYNTEIKATFPPTELKPLHAMLKLLSMEEYIPLAYYEDGTDKLLGYALLWSEGEEKPVLLDYFAVPECLRGKGIGAEILAQLNAFLAGRPMIIEAEAPDGGTEDAVRQSRLNFYTRCGARFMPYDCWLFGVHYRCLVMACGDADFEQIMEAHRRLYLRNKKRLMQKYVRIPYVPGEKLPKTIIWSDLKDE